MYEPYMRALLGTPTHFCLAEMLRGLLLPPRNERRRAHSTQSGPIQPGGHALFSEEGDSALVEVMPLGPLGLISPNIGKHFALP